MATYALIVAGGASERFGGTIPKQFRTIAGRPLLSWTIDRFQQAASIDHIVIVVAEEYLLHTNEKVVDPYGLTKVRKIVIGGADRSESVRKGLLSLPLSTEYVAIHDGARPLVAPEDIDRVVQMAKSDRAAILGTPAVDTVKRVEGSFVLATLDRAKLYLAQTPQVFQYDLIKEAHASLVSGEEQNLTAADVTDDASLIEQRGFKVKLVRSERPNFKVTTASDLLLAEAILKGEHHE